MHLKCRNLQLSVTTARSTGHSSVQKVLEVPKVPKEKYTERRTNPSLGPGSSLVASKLTRSNQPPGKRNAHWSSCISFSEMLEIVGVICFKKEVWLLIIVLGRG